MVQRPVLMSGNFFKHPIALLRVLYPSSHLSPKNTPTASSGAPLRCCFLAVSEETGGGLYEGVGDFLRIQVQVFGRSRVQNLLFHQNRIFRCGLTFLPLSPYTIRQLVGLTYGFRLAVTGAQPQYPRAGGGQGNSVTDGYENGFGPVSGS